MILKQESVRRTQQENQLQASQAQGHPSSEGVLSYR